MLSLNTNRLVQAPKPMRFGQGNNPAQVSPQVFAGIQAILNKFVKNGEKVFDYEKNDIGARVVSSNEAPPPEYHPDTRVVVMLFEGKNDDKMKLINLSADGKVLEAYDSEKQVKMSEADAKVLIEQLFQKMVASDAANDGCVKRPAPFPMF